MACPGVTVDTTNKVFISNVCYASNLGFDVEMAVTVKNGQSYGFKKITVGNWPPYGYFPKATPTGYNDMIAAFPNGTGTPTAIKTYLQKLGLVPK